MIQYHFNPDVFIHLSERKVSQIHLSSDVYVQYSTAYIYWLSVKHLIDKN